MGIGTASKLGTGTDSLSVWANSVQSGVRIWASASGSDNNDAIPLQVADYQGTEYFRVANTGNVGIGSAIPSQKLDVVGTVKATSFIGDGSGLTNLAVSGGLWVANSAGIHTTVDVGIGTTNPSAAVTVDNTSKLAVGIVSAYQLYGDGQYLDGVGFSQDDEGNLVAGTGAGAAIDADTCFNILIGCNTGAALNAGDFNIFMGCNSGATATTANHNIGLGLEALKCSEDTTYSVAIGTNAGRNN